MYLAGESSYISTINTQMSCKPHKQDMVCYESIILLIYCKKMLALNEPVEIIRSFLVKNM